MSNLFSLRNIPDDEPLFDHAVEFEKILNLQDKCYRETSSELKVPLERLRSNLKNTLEAHTKGRITAEELNHRLLTAENQCVNLAIIMEELLDLSSDTQDMHFKAKQEEKNLCDIAATIFDKFLDQAIASKCKLILDCPMPIIGMLDSKRIEQILSHLVSNAIKFAPKSTIEVRMFSSENGASIEVKDNGPGISFSDQSIIFDRYTKLNDSNQGFGMGLWLVKSIAEKLGGSVNVSSYLGEGSIFTVFLPLQRIHH